MKDIAKYEVVIPFIGIALTALVLAFWFTFGLIIFPEPPKGEIPVTNATPETEYNSTESRYLEYNNTDYGDLT